MREQVSEVKRDSKGGRRRSPAARTRVMNERSQRCRASRETRPGNATDACNTAPRLARREAAAAVEFESRRPLQRANVAKKERLMREQVSEVKRDSKKKRARVAQSAERVLGKDEVTSSILVAGSSVLELGI